MLLPVKYVMHHVKSLLLLELEENYGSDKVHSLAISELRQCVRYGIEDRTHFCSELFDDFVIWKSPIEIQLNLFTLLFVQIELIWLDGFHDELGPDVFP